MAAVALLMAVWWMTEAVPLAVTALVPLAAFPLLGLMDHKTVANQYVDQNIILFLSGFLIALAIENSGLHRRIALNIVALTGNRPSLIILGFMVATAFLSMWLSNTATTLMMLPIALGLLVQLDTGPAESAAGAKPLRPLGPPLLLGIAYSASLGGNATKIGTPPNISFASLFETRYETAIDFMGWLTYALPISVVLIAFTWIWLSFVIFRPQLSADESDADVVHRELAALGPMAKAEWRAMFVLMTAAGLWIGLEPYEGYGLGPLLGYGGTKLLGDSTPAVLVAIACFIIPSGKRPGASLLQWSDAVRVPWGVLLLFGGGLALAKGLTSSGLDQYLGAQLAQAIEGQPTWLMMLVSTAGVTTLTEFTSNTAAIQMVFPLLAGTVDRLSLEPMLLLLPAAMACNCAFMLPVATPPNAIVYGSGHVSIRDMVFAGLGLNIAAVLIITAMTFLLLG